MHGITVAKKLTSCMLKVYLDDYLDDNGDGKPDRLALVGMVDDVGGF